MSGTLSKKKGGFVIRLLKFLGTKDTIMHRKIFEQKQVVRAVDRGLGVCSGSGVDLFSLDADRRDYRDRVSEATEKMRYR